MLAVYFIGEIAGGSGFNTSTGLFCEIQLQLASDWEEVSGTLKSTIRTQTAYPDPDGLHVWNHPLELHFTTRQLTNWPVLVARVWRDDDSGSVHLIAAGVCALPCTRGFFGFDCNTWRPIGNWGEEARALFVGPPPVLLAEECLVRATQRRCELKTMSSGVVHLQFEVLLRSVN